MFQKHEWEKPKLFLVRELGGGKNKLLLSFYLLLVLFSNDMHINTVLRVIKNVENWSQKSVSKLLRDLQLFESVLESRTFWLQKHILSSTPHIFLYLLLLNTLLLG